jgi:ankyrin repeat protein
MRSTPDWNDVKNGDTIYCARKEDNLAVRVSIVLGKPKNVPPTVSTAAVRKEFVAACIEGDESAVAVLLRNVDDVNFFDTNGCSPLWYASGLGHAAVVDLLATRGAAIDMACAGSTPLAVAAIEGRAEVARLLISHGAQLECKDDDGATAFYLACAQGNIDTAEILATAGADINTIDTKFCTPCLTASANGIVPILQMLMDRGAQLERPNRAGQTPLVTASINGHLDIARHLLQAGADPTHQADDGMTAAIAAQQHGHDDILAVLRTDIRKKKACMDAQSFKATSSQISAGVDDGRQIDGREAAPYVNPQTATTKPAEQWQASANMAPAPALLHVPTSDECDQLFHRIDANGHGSLSLADISSAAKALWPGFDNHPVLMRAYQAADNNGSGWIGRREFQLLLEYVATFDRLCHAFNVTSQHEHRLTLQNFTDACILVGEELSVAQSAVEFAAIEKTFPHHSQNASGEHIFLDDFCTWFAQRKEMKQHAAKAVARSLSPTSPTTGKAPAAASRAEHAKADVGPSPAVSTDSSRAHIATPSPDGLNEMAAAEDHSRGQLLGLKLVELRKKAVAMGVDSDALEQARDSEDAKAAITELILEHEVFSGSKPLNNLATPTGENEARAQTPVRTPASTVQAPTYKAYTSPSAAVSSTERLPRVEIYRAEVQQNYISRAPRKVTLVIDRRAMRVESQGSELEKYPMQGLRSWDFVHGTDLLISHDRTASRSRAGQPRFTCRMSDAVAIRKLLETIARKQHQSSSSRLQTPNRIRGHAERTGSSIFDRLTDPKTFTGASKLRFDPAGRGLGKQGRVDDTEEMQRDGMSGQLRKGMHQKIDSKPVDYNPRWADQL